MQSDYANKATQILVDNDRGGYTVPTPRLYPYQWNWDSVFAALGFSVFDRGPCLAGTGNPVRGAVG